MIEKTWYLDSQALAGEMGGAVQAAQHSRPYQEAVVLLVQSNPRQRGADFLFPWIITFFLSGSEGSFVLNNQ